MTIQPWGPMPTISFLARPDDQPAFERLSEQLPVEVKEHGFSIHDTGGFFSAIEHAWWQVAEMRPNWWWRIGQAKERDGLLETSVNFQTR